MLCVVAVVVVCGLWPVVFVSNLQQYFPFFFKTICHNNNNNNNNNQDTNLTKYGQSLEN
jgi:hypothetical protein